MSHNIRYSEYPEKVNKKEVQAKWDHYVEMEDWQEGASGLPNPIRWLDKCYDSFDEAQKAIERLDNGWYDQLAVKYVSRTQDHDNVKLNELRTAATDAMAEFNKRDKSLYPKTLQANLITCKKCNSKLAKDYLKTNFCPVCHADLRPEHIIKSIKAAEDKWKREQKKIEDYTSKHGKKEIRWLVKIEYHT